jgi:hypothetical protein
MKPESESREAGLTSSAQLPESAADQQLMSRRAFTLRLAQLAVIVPVVAGVSLQAPKALALG